MSSDQVVYTVPMGHAADKNLLADIARITGGHMFHAVGGNELPATFAEIFARAQGEALVLPRTPVDVAGSTDCQIEGSLCPSRLESVQTPGFGCRCVTPGRGADAEKILEFDVEGGATRGTTGSTAGTASTASTRARGTTSWWAVPWTTW
jgi:hypothetical protein